MMVLVVVAAPLLSTIRIPCVAIASVLRVRWRPSARAVIPRCARSVSNGVYTSVACVAWPALAAKRPVWRAPPVSDVSATTVTRTASTSVPSAIAVARSVVMAIRTSVRLRAASIRIATVSGCRGRSVIVVWPMTTIDEPIHRRVNCYYCSVVRILPPSSYDLSIAVHSV